MPGTAESESCVLVVGAGPAGLTAAITLARYGITVLVVERRDEPSRHPKATVISTRSMELIRSWGLEAEVLAGGVEADMLAWSGRTLADATGGVALDVGYPTREQASAISPTAPACVPQDQPRQRSARPAGTRRIRHPLHIGRPVGRRVQPGQCVPRR